MLLHISSNGPHTFYVIQSATPYPQLHHQPIPATSKCCKVLMVKVVVIVVMVVVGVGVLLDFLIHHNKSVFPYHLQLVIGKVQ